MKSKTFLINYISEETEKEATSIPEMTHPEYDSMHTLWKKYRLTFVGGKDFIDKYLEKFSKREEETDFQNRKKITYCPAHAKAALTEIKNAIYQRVNDVKRLNECKTYKEAVNGHGLGVDLTGNTMDSFIGRIVLPDLLSVGKVGVYIDKPRKDTDLTLAETQYNRPYLYHYGAEDIRNWTFGLDGKLKSLLLRDMDYIYDETTNLPLETVEKFRLLEKLEIGIRITIYDKDGLQTDSIIINIKEIPFVIFEISNSLLTDVADYQVALLNLASSDMNYALKSNFPFYTEQFDMINEFMGLRQATKETQEMDSGAEIEGYAGKADQAAKANQNEIRTGVAQGRRYPKGVERPGFIHPSAEPLRASMEKQEKLQIEIRQLVNLAITNIEPKRMSAESKSEDRKTLEAGLSYIGLELEYGERQIAEIWNLYESKKVNIEIKYPRRYSLLTEKQRRDEGEELKKIQTSIPSLTYQKIIAKEIASITVGHKIKEEELDKIYGEIEKAKVIVTDADTIIKDFEAGLVDLETASVARGYPEGTVEKAKEDHAERIARIAEAQSSAASRGVQDNDEDIKNSDRDKQFQKEK